MAAPNDLFKPAVADSQLNPLFQKILKRGDSPARRLLERLFRHMPNPDGNFVKDFQTTGFDARIWELYLYAYGIDEGFTITRPFDRPDFLFTKGGRDVWVEAVTANASQGTNPLSSEGLDAETVMNEYVPIKLGTPLTNKLKKEYWRLPHVVGRALVLAIEDFHDPDPLRHTENGLYRYLYGISAHVISERGAEVRLGYSPVREHRVHGKSIPSGFFSLPGAEFISAVLFSNSATIAKFDRMGFDASIDRHLRMLRYGFRHDAEPTQTLPKGFAYLVGTRAEKWGEGLQVFHNPRALIKLPFEFFDGLGQHWIDSSGPHDYLPEFHPYMSVTEMIGFHEEPEDAINAVALAKANEIEEKLARKRADAYAQTEDRRLGRLPSVPGPSGLVLTDDTNEA